jgi:hypothetical protein
MIAVRPETKGMGFAAQRRAAFHRLWREEWPSVHDLTKDFKSEVLAVSFAGFK